MSTYRRQSRVFVIAHINNSFQIKVSQFLGERECGNELLMKGSFETVSIKRGFLFISVSFFSFSAYSNLCSSKNT